MVLVFVGVGVDLKIFISWVLAGLLSKVFSVFWIVSTFTVMVAKSTTAARGQIFPLISTFDPVALSCQASFCSSFMIEKYPSPKTSPEKA